MRPSPASAISEPRTIADAPVSRRIVRWPAPRFKRCARACTGKRMPFMRHPPAFSEMVIWKGAGAQTGCAASARRDLTRRPSPLCSHRARRWRRSFHHQQNAAHAAWKGRVSANERIRANRNTQRALAHPDSRLWRRPVHDLGLPRRLDRHSALRVHDEPVALRVRAGVRRRASSAACCFRFMPAR